MRHELYISGQKADMEAGEAVVLEYQSNILGDISKITGSYSYTIHLPTTRRNRQIFGDAQMPSSSSQAVRTYLGARYYRNGIDMIGPAKAVLLSAGDSYEVALTWGPLGGFDEWAKNGASLQKIGEDRTVQWRLDDGSSSILTSYVSRVSPLIFADYDPGVDLKEVGNTIRVARHPSCNLYWLFNEVMRSAGITYTIPDSVASDMKNKAILLATRNASDATNILRGVKGTQVKKTAAIPGYLLPAGTVTDPLTLVSGAGFVIRDYNTSVRIRIRATFPSAKDATVTIYASGTPTGQRTEFEKTYIPADGKISIDIDELIDLTDATSYFVRITGFDATELIDTSASATYEVYPQTDEVKPGNYFPLSANLPDIKQVDFVKAVCQLYGLAAIYAPPKVAFVTYDVFSSNKSKAVDWTGKLMATGSEAPKEIRHSLDEMAQRNWFRYKEDPENLSPPVDGYIEVNDKTLESERDMAVLPFAATRGNRIRHYTAEQDEDKTWTVNLESVEPRILSIRNDDSGKCVLTFEESQRFQFIIPARYGYYQEIVKEPVIIEVRMRLTEWDLSKLDFTIPVYLAQYGRYYAIKSIKTSSNSLECDVELLQIK